MSIEWLLQEGEDGREAALLPASEGALCHDCLMLLWLAALELGMANTLDMAGLA